MSPNFFAYISRMRYIGRWSLMRNALPENIQEHSHMVAVIAHALAVIRRDICGIPCDPDRCASVALFHDSSEILTGDLPTPIKYHSAQIQSAYKQVEKLACDKLLATLPEELRGIYESLLYGRDAEELHDIVKAADKLSESMRVRSFMSLQATVIFIPIWGLFVLALPRMAWLCQALWLTSSRKLT